METKEFIPFHHERLSNTDMRERSSAFFERMNQRRSIREFSSETFDKQILENIIKTAGTAPSGAHKQPWTFCVVESSDLKKKIRDAAEQEEYENYHGRMSEEWLEDLKKFGTNHIKEFLELAPYLVIVFKKVYDLEEGDRKTNYYVNESVGIAVGLLLAAIQNAGLASLTHTPSPMNFLAEILNRPKNERAFLLIPVGFPAEGVQVPDIKRKRLENISQWY